jgi:hypothetical protein
MILCIFVIEPACVMHINVIASYRFIAVANNGIDFFEFTHGIFPISHKLTG